MVDISIIVILILFALLGLKRGMFKSIVYLAAILIVAIVSYEFKDYLGNILMKLLPFIKFKGDFEGITVVNVLFYKGLAFLIVFLLLMCVLSIIIKISGLLDLLVKATIILEIPSKLIGMILGLAEGVIVCYVGLFILVQIPVEDNPINESKIAPYIINKTPLLNKVFVNGYETAEKVYNIIDEKIENYTQDEVNNEALDELKSSGSITDSDLETLKKEGKKVVSDVIKKVTGDDGEDTENIKKDTKTDEGETND